MDIKIKKMGQVYTPKHIVEIILDQAEYFWTKILWKHVIDNSCGDGAILTSVIERYADAYLKQNGYFIWLEKDLERYIHWIELEEEAYHSCLNNLKNKIKHYLWNTNIQFDIKNENALWINCFDKKMDFVLWNPPYVKVHNISWIISNNPLFFKKEGMTDLFIAFYDIGLKMLKEDGILSYITPSSIFTSYAWRNFRAYVIKNSLLKKVVNLWHYSPFKNISTYTAILTLDKKNTEKEVEYYTLNEKKGLSEKEIKKYDNFYQWTFIFWNSLPLSYLANSEKFVKNWLATLSDGVFIKDDFPFHSDFIIPIIKASKGKNKKAIFPYDKEFKLVDFNKFNIELRKYLLENKKLLIKKDKKEDNWYAYWRTQGILDVYQDKIAINNLIRDKKDLKPMEAKSWTAVYSWLYILWYTLEEIKRILLTDDFVNYIQWIWKYKSSGYYTFSSKDLERYILTKR